MALGKIKNPYDYFSDLNGAALDNGKIYIGTAGLDAETNPKAAYFDAAGTVSAAQPIRTTDGYPSSGGAAREIYTSGDYSITVKNENDELIYSVTSGNQDGPYAPLDNTPKSYATRSTDSLTEGKALAAPFWAAGTPYVAKVDGHAGTVDGVDDLGPIAVGGRVLASQYGATEDGDNTDALRNLVYDAIYEHEAVGAECFIDIGVSTLTGELPLGYGDAFHGLTLHGAGVMQGANSDKHAGTALVFSNDGIGISMQGGRTSGISGMWVEGLANDALNAIDDDVDFNLSDPDAYWDNALTSAGVTLGTQYRVQAGLVVDPRSGPEPAVPFDDLTFLYDQAGAAQYDKALSSKWTLDNVSFSGFEVGAGIQICDADGNGDWPSTDGSIEFDKCKFALSIGNSQMRGLSAFDMKCRTVHTCVTTNKHGRQVGRLPGILNIGCAEFVYQLFDINDPANLTHDFHIEAEALTRLGNISGGVKTSPGRIKLNGTMNLRGNATRGVPTVMLEGSAARSFVFIDGLLDAYGASFFEPRNTQWNGGTLKQREDQDFAYMRHAYNATAGGIVLNPTIDTLPQKVVYSPQAVADGATQEPALTDVNYPYVTRDFGIPIWMEEIRHPVCGSTSRIVNTDTDLRYSTMNGATKLSGVTRSGTRFSFTNSDINGLDISQNRNVVNGSIWVHEDGIVAVVASTDLVTKAQSIELLNGYQGADLEDATFSPDSGTWYRYAGNLFAAPRLLRGDFTANSEIVTNVESWGVGGWGTDHETDYGLTAGDRLAHEYSSTPDMLKTSSTKDADLLSFDTGANTITMGEQANVSGTGVLMPFFTRATPANETDRFA